MSLAALRWASQLRGVTLAELRVALVLADHHNPDDGRCDPAVTTIAKEAGIKPRWVKRCLQGLRAKGHLEPGDGGGRTHTTSYRLPVRLRSGETVAAPAEKGWPLRRGNGGRPGPGTVAAAATRNGERNEKGNGGGSAPLTPRRVNASEDDAPAPHTPPPSESEPAAAETAPGLELERVPSDLYEHIRRIGRGGVRRLPTPGEFEAERADRLRDAEAETARRAG